MRADDFAGPFRREADSRNSEMLKRLNQQKADAHEALRKIREERGLESGDRFDLMNPNDIDMQ